MDRLTKTDTELLQAYKDTGLEPEECKTLYGIISKLSGELAKYKEAEKEGRLIVTQYNVGDTLYEIAYDGGSHVVSSLCTGLEISLAIKVGNKWRDSEKIGKTVFRSRKEAEAALRGGGG